MRASKAYWCIVTLIVAACAQEETPAEPATSDAPAQANTNPNVPDEYADTAWRVVAEDGARYVTYLDSDGTYRDLRNGDPFQTGEWAFVDGPNGGQLCFNPDDENSRESCWQPETMRDDSLFARGPEDRRIELTRVEHTPANDVAEADDAAAE